MRLQFHSAAQAEAEEAAAFYEHAQPGLGEALSADLTTALQNVLEHPDIGPVWPTPRRSFGVRKCVLTAFPFSIAYMIRDSSIVVIAIAHMKRKPFYWLDRVRPH